MNVIEYALISLKKNFGHNLLKSLMFIILLSSIFICLVLINVINRAETNIRKSIPPIITVNLPNNLYSSSELDFIERLDVINMIHTAGESYYVDFYEYSISMQMRSLYLRQYESEEQRLFLNSMGSFIPDPGSGFDNALIQGFANSEIIYFRNGKQELIAGRTFSDLEIDSKEKNYKSVAIISKKLANYNNLWIGDKFTLSVVEDWDMLENRIDFEFEIIGIRHFKEESLSVISENLIFVPNNVVKKINSIYIEHSNWPTMVSFPGSPHFILNNHEFINNFLEELATIFPYNTEFNDYSDRFAALSHSIKILSRTLIPIMIFTILCFVLLKFLMYLIIIKSLKKECGILISLGMKKSQILKTFLTENLILFMPCILISLIIGIGMSKLITNDIVINEIESFTSELPWHKTQPTFIESTFGFDMLTQDDFIDALDFTFDYKTTVLIFLISSITFFGMSTLPILLMTSIKPIKLINDY